jgi:hypothetical protein
MLRSAKRGYLACVLTMRGFAMGCWFAECWLGHGVTGGRPMLLENKNAVIYGRGYRWRGPPRHL